MVRLRYVMMLYYKKSAIFKFVLGIIKIRSR